MAKLAAIFLDDGGVLNDNSLRGPQWRRLIREFFAPRLGGTPGRWAEANLVVFDRIFNETLGSPGFRPPDYRLWWREYQLHWLREMATEVGVAVPKSKEDAFELAMEAVRYITARVRAEISGASDTVKELGRLAPLYLASGGHSVELVNMLDGLGIRDLIRTPYGADIINEFKGSVDYYRKVFEHAGVDPRQVLVVDNEERCVIWADSAGAQTCLVAPKRPNRCNAGAVIPRFADLPELLERLA